MTETITAPTAAPTAATATIEIARRALRRYYRTPGVFVIGIVQSALFLFCFRYVFGGAIHTDAASYVAYLLPGYVATIVLFNGSGIAVAITEDRAEGFTDRLLSLPIPRRAIVVGRAVADATTNAWAIGTTLAFGFLFGFRLAGSLDTRTRGARLCLLYGVAFTFVFTVIGLIAPNGQAAQGMSMIAFILAFFSNTYVPVDSMPGWLQPFAAHQPVTPMVEAVRSRPDRLEPRRRPGHRVVRACSSPYSSRSPSSATGTPECATSTERRSTPMSRQQTHDTEITTGAVQSADGTTIGYRRFGDGPAIIVVSGAMISSKSHLGLARALADDFAVYLPDRRGRGLSGPYGKRATTWIARSKT